MYETVIDKKMLKQMGTMLAAGSSAAFTSVLAYSAYTVEASAAATVPCTLSPTQLGVVQSLMAAENETCSCARTYSLFLGCPFSLSVL